MSEEMLEMKIKTSTGSGGQQRGKNRFLGGQPAQEEPQNMQPIRTHSGRVEYVDRGAQPSTLQSMEMEENITKLQQ